MRRPASYLRAFLRSERGHAATEFALLFPVLLVLTLSTMELGIATFRKAMLVRGLDEAVRQVRISSTVGLTHDDMKDMICEFGVGLPGCSDSLRLEMRPVDPRSWSGLDAQVDCVDRSEPIQPVRSFNPGSSNELMILRACIRFKPLFPTSGMGKAMEKDGSGEYSIVARSAFVQEPT